MPKYLDTAIVVAISIVVGWALNWLRWRLRNKTKEQLQFLFKSQGTQLNALRVIVMALRDGKTNGEVNGVLEDLDKSQREFTEFLIKKWNHGTSPRH